MRTDLGEYTPQELIAAAVNNCGVDGVLDELARQIREAAAWDAVRYDGEPTPEDVRECLDRR